MNAETQSLDASAPAGAEAPKFTLDAPKTALLGEAQAKLTHLFSRNLKQLREEYQNEDDQSPEMTNLYRSLINEKLGSLVGNLQKNSPDGILTEYARGLRVGEYDDSMKPIFFEAWSQKRKEGTERDFTDKLGGLLEGAVTEAPAAVGSYLRGGYEVIKSALKAGPSVVGSMSPERIKEVAKITAGAETSVLGLKRLGEGVLDTDLRSEKAFDENFKSVRDLEAASAGEGYINKKLGASAEDFRSIGLEFTEDDLKSIADMSNFLDPTDVVAFGVGTFGKGLFKIFGKTAAGEVRALARTFKTAEEAAAEAEKYNTVARKLRVGAGKAMQKVGQKLQEEGVSSGLRSAGVFGTVLAAGGDPETAVLAAVASKALPIPGKRLLTPTTGRALEAVGRRVAADLPDSLEIARRGWVDFRRELAQAMGTGALVATPFAFGAESPEQAGAIIGTGALAAGTGFAVHKGSDAFGRITDVARNSFEPSRQIEPKNRDEVTSYGDDAALDQMHAQAVGDLANSSNNAVEQLRRTVVGPDGRLYVGRTADDTVSAYKAVAKEPLTPEGEAALRAAGGFTLKPEDTKNGKAVAYVRRDTEALFHEPGHLMMDAMRVSSDPAVKKMAETLDAKAREIFGAPGSEKFEAMKAKYESRMREGGAKDFTLSPEAVYDEILAEHFTTVLSGAPAIKFGGNPSIVREIYSSMLGLGEALGMYKPGTDARVGDVVSSRQLQLKPSRELSDWVQFALEARQRELDKAIPSVAPVQEAPEAPAAPAPTPAQTPAAAGLQNIEPVGPTPGFKKGDPIGNVSTPDGELRLTGAKVVSDDGGPLVRVEGVAAQDITDANGNVVVKAGDTFRSDVTREWLTSPVSPTAGPTPVAAPTVDVGALKPVPAELTKVPGAKEPPAQPVTPPPAAGATPNVRGVTETKRQPFTGTTPETLAENRKVLAEELAKPQHQRVPLQTDYFSAIDTDNNPKKLTQPQREYQRKLAETADNLGFKNPLRQQYDKMFLVLSGNDKNVFGFSLDKLIQNLDILRGWVQENPQAAAGLNLPYKDLASSELATDMRNYMRNQANGYGGGGEKIVRPAGTPAGMPVENRNFSPVQLPKEKRDFINFLMGLEGVSALQNSVGAQFVASLARANGIPLSTTTAGTPQRVSKLEFNPVSDRFRKAGFDPVLLNQVVENLNVSRMTTPLARRADVEVRGVSPAMVQAGLMPDSRRVNIGLDVIGGERLTPDDVIKVLAKYGLQPERYEVRQSATEPTFIAEIRNADPETFNKISSDLKQEAIAVYNPADNSGALYGPKAEKWGPFNKDYFVDLTDTPAQSPVDMESQGRQVFESVSRGETQPRYFPRTSEQVRKTAEAATYSWMRPDGTTIPVQRTHGETARSFFKNIAKTDMEAIEMAWSKNWLRVANQGDDLYVHIEGGNQPTAKQLAELKNVALEVGKRRIVADLGPNSKILWTENDDGDRFGARPSYMPAKPAEPAEIREVQFKRLRRKGSLGGVETLAHFSSVQNEVLDPQVASGKGAATPKDLRGLPRGYFYRVGKSAYEPGIADRPNIYLAKVDGNAIYDLNADPLNFKRITNEEKRDQAIRDAGFAGMRGKTQGIDMVAMFDPVKLTEGTKENVFSKKQLAEQEAARAATPEEGDYAAEYEAWQKKLESGEPLYMPAPSDPKAEHVDRAAIRFEGKVLSGEKNDYHALLIDNLMKKYPFRGDIDYDSDNVERGFVSSTGRFLSRAEAFKLAREGGQIGRRMEKASQRFGDQLEAIKFNKDREDASNIRAMPAAKNLSEIPLREGAALGTVRLMPGTYERLLEKFPLTDEQKQRLEGKTGFAFVSDWADSERPYVTKLGREVDVLRGGLGYSYHPEIYGKGGWAGTFSALTNRVVKHINETDGFGLVVMGGPESSSSSRAFSLAFIEELKDRITAKEITQKQADRLVKKAFKSVGHEGVETLADYERVLPISRDVDPVNGLTFDDRDKIVRSIGGIENSRKYGAPNWNDVLRGYNIQKGKVSPGQIVSVIEFTKGEPLRRAEEVGVSKHPSYEAVIMGKGLGLLKEKVMISDFFSDLFAADKTTPNMHTRKVQTKMPRFRFGEGSASLSNVSVKKPE